MAKDSLLPQIESWLGTNQVDAELTVSVQGSLADPRDLTLEIRRGAQIVGQRRFQPAPFVCSQLEATVALAVAMGLKVSLREDLLDTLEGAGQRRGSLGGLVRVGFGLLPRTSWGVGFAGAQSLGTRFALRAEAFVDLAGKASFDTAPGGFDTLLLSGQLSACALFPFQPAWGARACLGLALGALQARGRDYTQTDVDWLAWIAASNSVALSARVSDHWWFDLPCSVVIPLNKVTFGVQHDDGTVAAVRALPRIGFTVAMGPQYLF